MNTKNLEKMFALVVTALVLKDIITTDQLDELKELVHSEEELTHEWTMKIMEVLTK